MAHTKLVTQDLEAQMVTVKSKIEEEKQKAEELQRKNEQLAAQARVTAIFLMSKSNSKLTHTLSEGIAKFDYW